MAQDLNDLMKDVEALRNRNNTFLLDNDPVAQLEPREVFRYFAAITKVPRPSHHEDKMRAFLVHFAEQQQLSWEMDGENVLIRKPASQGQEHRPTLVLQAHMDMVCEKETDVQIDFMNDPIDTYIDGEWVRARGTTLGADDGMGVAMMLAILADKQHPHGAIEALFTADEEQSFTGVDHLSSDPLKARYRINIDRESYGLIGIGSAGASKFYAHFDVTSSPLPDGYTTVKLSVDNLAGGHSAHGIRTNFANALKLLNAFIKSHISTFSLHLCAFEGGGLLNAIPRQAYAVVAVPATQCEALREAFLHYAQTMQEQHRAANPDATFTFTPVCGYTGGYYDDKAAMNVIRALEEVHYGIYKWNEQIGDCIEMSNNPACITEENGQIKVGCMARGFSDESCEEMTRLTGDILSRHGGKVTYRGANTAWKADAENPLVQIAQEQFKRLEGYDAQLYTTHGGLECGVIMQKYPDMKIINIGATVLDYHTPSEALEISTLGRCYRWIWAIMDNL